MDHHVGGSRKKDTPIWMAQLHRERLNYIVESCTTASTMGPSLVYDSVQRHFNMHQANHTHFPSQGREIMKEGPTFPQ